MSFATTVNFVTIILCAAVLVQCARMMRSLETFRSADLPGTAAALDSATAQAHQVLKQIREVLAAEADPKLRSLNEAKLVADELAVMIGIANASADRMLENARSGATSEPREMAA